MMKFYFLCACLFCAHLWADGRSETFAKFPNRVFVETGSSYGNGIDMALSVGFRSIYSIEVQRDLFQHCKERFANHPEVVLFHGYSEDLLYDIIKDIDEPITFWLDGHGHEDSPMLGRKYSPIMQELEAIKKHPIKTHTIMVDDVRLFGSLLFDHVPASDIVNKVLEINPNYEISYELGYVSNDILVAKIRK